jgi:hypothetical protein
MFAPAVVDALPREFGDGQADQRRSIDAEAPLIGVETDVIGRLVNNHLNSRIDELLPWVYTSTQTVGLVA